MGGKTYTSLWIKPALCTLVILGCFTTSGATPDADNTHGTHHNVMGHLPKTLLSHDPPASVIHQRLDAVSRDHVILERDLLKDGFFKGLYLFGDIYKNLEHQEDSNRTLGVHWDLFEDGYYASKTALKKKKLQSELEYWQLLAVMHKSQLDNRLFQLKANENLIQLSLADDLCQYLDALLAKRKAQLAHGFVTQTDLDDVLLKHKQSHLLRDYLRNTEQRKLTQAEYTLLNKIETITLKSAADLALLASQYNIGLKIQTVFKARADFYPRYWDNVAFRLYYENRDEFEDPHARIDNRIGLRVRLPIDFRHRRSSIIKTQKRAYDHREKSIQHRLLQKIQSLSQSFTFVQQRIRLGQAEYAALARRVRNAKKVKKANISSLPNTPERKLENLGYKEILLQRKLYNDRVDALRALVQLQALTHSPTIASLTIPDSGEGETTPFTSDDSLP